MEVHSNEKENRKVNKKTKQKKKTNSNRQIMNVTYIFLLIFVMMTGYFVNYQMNEGAEIINNAYNKREEILAKSIIRGNILSNDKTILAQTLTKEDGTEIRNYPYEQLFAHAVGYSTHGQTGIELLANYRLLTSNSPMLEIAADDLHGKKHIGDNVVTSLDISVSEAAYQAMEGYKGAVIAIEPATGKIITLISKPDFNPNVVADIYSDLIADDNNSNLLNRATGGLYTPGSTFKLFTLYEYIRENPDYEDYHYDCNGSISVDEYRIKCSGGAAHGEEDIYDSFAYSCNSSFVNMGLTLNKNAFVSTCKRLLFDSDLPIHFPYSQSEISLSEKSSVFETMQTVMGQGKTLVTPIHLCMIAAAIANDGLLMKPYIVTSIENHNGKTIKTYHPSSYREILLPEETAVLKKFLRSVVEYGTAKRLNTEKYIAYGKTGTAQIEDGSRNNSLFMGFAEQDGKKLAICVVLEDTPEGTIPAVTVAKAVFDSYYFTNENY